MSAHKRTTLLFATAILAAGPLVLPACSSHDEGAGDAADVDSTADADADPAGEDSSTEGPESSTGVDCEEVLTAAEVEELFGEPAVLDDLDATRDNEQIGQSTCTWTTVEDEGNTDDLASQLLVLQYYGGGTTSGRTFYDPEMQYPDSEPLDIGDEGVIDTEGGIDIAFVKGDAAGFLTWTVIDLGGGEHDQAAGRDTMIELAQAFEERAF